MKKKTLILAVLAALVAVFAAGCTSDDAEVAATTTAEATAEIGALELTLDELAAYDGRNGNPAYVAVDGVIYDMTDVAAWKNGTHNGNTAGNDLTDIIKNVSPHGESVLKDLPVVGTLKTD